MSSDQREVLDAMNAIFDRAVLWTSDVANGSPTLPPAEWTEARRLMLTAHEMLASLEAMTAIVGKMGCINNSDLEEFRQYSGALAVIRKAKGESTTQPQTPKRAP